MADDDSALSSLCCRYNAIIGFSRSITIVSKNTVQLNNTSYTLTHKPSRLPKITQSQTCVLVVVVVVVFIAVCLGDTRSSVVKTDTQILQSYTHTRRYQRNALTPPTQNTNKKNNQGACAPYTCSPTHAILTYTHAHAHVCITRQVYDAGAGTCLKINTHTRTTGTCGRIASTHTHTHTHAITSDHRHHQCGIYICV